MAFSNSSLAAYKHISPNRNSPRNQPITKITIHHMAGVLSLEEFDNIVSNPNRQMSSNYAIDKDGRIGLFCPESDRSWCSSSSWNDNRSITIEVSNSSTGGEWPISKKVYSMLIALCADICKRNLINKLTFTGDQNGSLTYHYMFNATACPGPYIKSLTNDICRDVNKILNGSTPSNDVKPATTTTSSGIKEGDLVSISDNATWYDGGSIPTWVKQERWYVSSIAGSRAVLGMNETKSRNIVSPIDVKYLSSVQSSYKIQLDKSVSLYDNPSGKIIGTVGTTGIFTIVQETSVGGTKYGKLKSGAGWVVISSNTTTNASSQTPIKKGDKVEVINPIIYGTNKKFTVYVKTYYVLEVSKDRVVISSDGKNVTTAIDIKNIKKI